MAEKVVSIDKIDRLLRHKGLIYLHHSSLTSCEVGGAVSICYPLKCFLQLRPPRLKSVMIALH